MAGDDADDPWGFLAARKEEMAARAASGAEPAVAEAAVDRGRGEIREVSSGPSLRRRAWPIALTLLLVSFAGFITEMVCGSQMIAAAGPNIVLLMYPLGGLGLALAALLQFRVIDHKSRLPMLRLIGLAYGLVFTLALVLINANVVPLTATGVAWLLGDQLNFLVPLLVWSLAGDEFNAAEGRRIFGWIVTWVYVGQVSGLVVATASPSILTALHVPLPMLLAVVPLVCLVVALWLPHMMRHSMAAQGSGRSEHLQESLNSAWEFVAGVPAWRFLLIASATTFVGGMLAHLSFMLGAGQLIGSDAGALQTVFAATSLGAFLICWLVQAFAAERIQERLGIPGTMLILPIAAVLASVLLAAGFLLESIVPMIIGISLWRIPRWSVDENARRAALALVPDERRARVSFFVDLGPVALGLLASGPIALIGVALGWTWAIPVLGGIAAALGVWPAIQVMRNWEAGLLSWRLRRRKQNRTIDLS